MSPARVHLLHPGADLLEQAARHILARHRETLPDLSRLTVLLPFNSTAPQLRRALATQAGRGLLGPQIQSLGQFAQARAPDITSLPALDCRLRLASALARHRNLFPGVSDTQAADALFALFEELIAHGISLDDEAALTKHLQDAYRAPPGLHFLSFEAQIAHRLFAAYLEETGGRSPAAVYRQQLAKAFAELRDDESLYLLGYDQLLPAEMAALGASHAELWIQGRLEGHDGLATTAFCRRLSLDVSAQTGETTLLDAAFSSESLLPPLLAGLAPDWELTLADGPEHEARCVDVAVREALLAGARNVAVISQDRRLARRLRALLDRAGIALHDPAGWALSTSSAAASVAAWLECLASDFGFRPLLTLLKSDFMATPTDALRALERELVYGRGIEAGLETYRDAAKPFPVLTESLAKLKVAARLMPRWNLSKPGEAWCHSLKESLQKLDLWPRLQNDEAGEQLTRLIEELAQALRQHRLMLDGDGFRELLDRLLERETFIPKRGRGPVQLLTLEQSQNLRCDVLILAGVSRERLPGQTPAEPLFSAAVRAELGLPSWRERHALALARLRRLLQSAPRVVMSYAPESPGEEAVLSPWIEALEAAVTSAGGRLRNTRLPRLAASAQVEIAEETSLPGATSRPAPHTAPALIPNEISATAHQSLVDCPYQFFAGSLLKLRAERAPDEDPDRSDYGQRVHRILQRYADSPAPSDREQSQALLKAIAQEIFAPDLRAHARAQLWVAEFHSQMPELLDWLEQRPAYREVQSELKLAQALGKHTLTGRADRLEILGNGQRTLVDYKTGRVPKEEEVTSSEAVQLAHYAALDTGISRAEYLALKDQKKNLVIDEGLPELRARTLERLSATLARLETGAPLTAQGDDATCDYCDYRGLCRKGDWRE